MAKKSMIARDEKRQKTVARFAAKRAALERDYSFTEIDRRRKVCGNRQAENAATQCKPVAG